MITKKEPNLFKYDLTQILDVPAKKAIKCLVKSLGQKVERGELIACKKGLLKKRNFYAPIEGILDSLTEEGVLRIKTPFKKIAKTKAPFSDQETIKIKGNWGKGAQALGKLFCLEKEADIFNLKGDHQGQILALYGKINRGLWFKSKSIGIKGIVCGGLPDEKFGKEIEKEVLLAGSEERILALPLVVLGGKGEIPKDTWQVLKENQDKEIFIEGDSCQILIPK